MEAQNDIYEEIKSVNPSELCKLTPTGFGTTRQHTPESPPIPSEFPRVSLRCRAVDEWQQVAFFGHEEHPN